MSHLRTFQKSFQHVLDAEVERAVRRSRAVTSNATILGIIAHAARIVRQDGKRLRPYLANFMYRAAGGKRNADALRLSVALELFHAFALIHDDVMDRGKTRHGLTTVHLEVAKRLRAEKRAGDASRVGESQAILAGDLMLTWALGVFEEDVRISSDRVAAARRVFHAMSEEVIVGQMLDVDLSTRRSASLRNITEKMLHKTAGYSFVKPLQFGAALAGQSRRLWPWCKDFGSAIGLAFQIQDDLLDLTATSAQSHKTAFSDLTERQQTIFTQYIADHGTPKQRAELGRMFGRPLTERDRPRINKLFSESGALAHGESRIRRLLARAETALNASPLSASAKREGSDLIAAIRSRSR